MVVVVAVDALGRTGQPGAGLGDAVGGPDETGGHGRWMVRLAARPGAGCRDANLRVDVGEAVGEGQERFAQPLDGGTKRLE
jgi:hypothetical protein